MCTGVKDIYNSVTLDTADPTCLVSNAVFDEAHICASNTCISINSVTHVCFSYWPSWVTMTAVCHMNHDACSEHGGVEVKCQLKHH